MKPNPVSTRGQRNRKGLAGNDLLIPLIGIAMALAAMLGVSYLLINYPDHSTTLIAMQLVLLVASGFLIYIIQHRVRRDLLEPLHQVRNWAYQIQDGDLTARIEEPKHEEFLKLAIVMNDLGESLQSLTQEMDDKVKEQTQRLEKKTRILEILYEVAAASTSEKNIEELLLNYLYTLLNIVHANAATVRIITDDNRQQVIGSIGIDEEFDDDERVVPVERCLCVQNYRQMVINCDVNRSLCGNLLQHTLKPSDTIKTIAIPIHYKYRTLAIYHLFLNQDGVELDDELTQLLTNITQHLSLALEKARVDNDSKRLTIMQERTMLAHELHDSLAQTLASLRFQVNLLQKTIQSSGNQAALNEVIQLKNGLDEANVELRELLAHFRVHMDERGLIPATEALIERFDSESGIDVFFQNECEVLRLPPLIEVQVLHIIQESLTNIRKHSQAENVRVLIRQTSKTDYHVLVEDDGVGISELAASGQPGEHVGLTIMEERAKRINGRLTIDSEPGEGTRIELDFSISEEQNYPQHNTPGNSGADISGKVRTGFMPDKQPIGQNSKTN